MGFERTTVCSPSLSNMPTPHPHLVSEYLEREVALGRMSVILPEASLTGRRLQLSPIGLIPKRNRPNKWRLIVDLSAPVGASVNDGISKELSSLYYPTVDHLAAVVARLGRGSYLVKADVKEAYRAIPVHPQDRWLLGIKWEDKVYVDNVLPFGLRSAPKIFSAVADAAQWIMIAKGMKNLLHYLDDFICAAASMPAVEEMKQVLVDTWEELGIPLEPSKLEGPATCMTFLGIEVDTVALQLRLPMEKLSHLKAILQSTLGKRAFKKRDLQSLVGLLQHATKVVWPGRSFLRRLHALLADVGADRDANHWIRPNRAAKADIVWWHTFVSSWNGVSMLWDQEKAAPAIRVVSDASGSWGCGAYWLSLWFQIQWPHRLQPCSIQVKELIPVVVAAALYGKKWEGKVVEFVIDNQAVVEIVKSGYSREAHLMHLTRLLVLIAYRCHFRFTASHIVGSDNSMADAISRNDTQSFLEQAPVTPSSPSQVPDSLLDLVALNVTWLTPQWAASLNVILDQCSDQD